jgi:hypothetical protein
LQDPAKFNQIGIFGLKSCHLATLAWQGLQDNLKRPLQNLHLNEVPK